jgi:hypothetical protein
VLIDQRLFQSQVFSDVGAVGCRSDGMRHAVKDYSLADVTDASISSGGT